MFSFLIDVLLVGLLATMLSNIGAINFQLKDYNKANQLLNCVSSCSGICNDETTKTANCGCS